MVEYLLKRLRLVNYLFIICILIATLLVVRNLINISLSKKKLHIHLSGDKTVEDVPQARKDLMSYSPILHNNPFGRSLKFHPIALRKSSNEVIGGSTANLLLVGTAVGPDRLSYAIFEDKSRPGRQRQEVVRYGDNVFNYGVLSGIGQAYVELKQDSKTMTIPIVKMEHNTNISRSHNAVPESSFAKKVGEREYLLNREKVHQALDNPESLLTDARLLPNIKNNKQEGFKMFEVKRGGIYQSLGLRNGDILLKVNELEISDPEVAIKAMTALKGMDKVSLDIIRRGENLSMTYEIR